MDEVCYSIWPVDLPSGGYRAVTCPSEALPPCWRGPVREWPLEAARDHGACAPEALENFLREQAEAEGWDGTRRLVASAGEDLVLLYEEFPGLEFEVWLNETYAEIPGAAG